MAQRVVKLAVTDSTYFAGNYGTGAKTITCITDEGAITPGTGIDAYGREQAITLFATGLAEGDWVALRRCLKYLRGDWRAYSR